MSLISVIIPVKGRYGLLQETVASVASQTYPQVELIVVDDGSDHPVETYVFEEWGKHRHKENLQVVRQLPSNANVARNRGVSLSKGEFLIFLDSDDLLAPRCIEGRMARTGQTSAINVSNGELFGNRPGDLNLIFNVDTVRSHLERFIFFDYPWQTTGPTWPRTVFQDLGGFDESLLSWQDWDLHVRALISGLEFSMNARCDYYYRTDNAEKTTTKKHCSLEHLIGGIRLMHKIEKQCLEKGLLTKAFQRQLEKVRTFLIKALLAMRSHSGLRASMEEGRFTWKIKTWLRVAFTLALPSRIADYHRVERIVWGRRRQFPTPAWNNNGLIRANDMACGVRWP